MCEGSQVSCYRLGKLLSKAGTIRFIFLKVMLLASRKKRIEHENVPRF